MQVPWTSRAHLRFAEPTPTASAPATAIEDVTQPIQNSSTETLYKT